MGRTPAPIHYSDIDRAISAELEHAHDHAGRALFDTCWRRLAIAPEDMGPRRRLAALYSQMIHAERVGAFDNEGFARCTRWGHWALALDSTCVGAHEQLAIAYSIALHASDAAYFCDRTVAYFNLVALKPLHHTASIDANVASSRVSPNFYYAYWLTFRGDGERQAQAAKALALYWQAPASQRSFDAAAKSHALLAQAMQTPG